MVHYIANRRCHSFLAAIMRHGYGRRHVVWTDDLTGALGFDDIDLPLARAIIEAIGGGYVVVPECLPSGQALSDAIRDIRDAECKHWPREEMESFIRTTLGLEVA